MGTFPEEAWAEVDALFREALKRPPEEREAFLDEATGDDDRLRAAMSDLLRAESESGGFLARPVDALTDLPWDEVLAEVDRVTREARRGDAEHDRSGERIGAYRLVRELGRGGMATVYLAERADGLWEQQVALKLIRRGLGTEDVIRRFLAERQILSSLNHPNIAHLLDGGTTREGLPYLVMEYVEGTPITEYCDQRRLPVEQRLRLFGDVGRAVQHAHERQVVHRDLKPSNILVTGEGRVKLLDFGIAKILDPVEESERPGGATRPLTPEYASPEQLRGRSITPASDVYQLGLLLCALLAGRPPRGVAPAPADGPEGAASRDGESRPPSRVLWDQDAGDRAAAARRRSTTPGKLRRRLTGDLDRIACLATSDGPERRYATAGELTDDVERHLTGRPVHARPDRWHYRLRKFAGRNRTGAIAAGIALLSLAGYVATFFTVGAHPASGSGDLPVLAVGEIRSAASGDTLAVARSLPGLLTTNLSRLPELRVLGAADLHRIGPDRPEAGGDGRGRSLVRAARRAGADELLLGTLHRGAAGRVRLDLQRLRLDEEGPAREFSLEDEDVFALVDRATERIAADLGLALPDAGLADVTTSSLLAYRFYDEGLNAYYEGDNRSARRLFGAALEEDTAFAMAAYYRAQASGERNQVAFRTDLRRALRFAERASERERLLIQVAWLQEMDDPRQTAVAGTLATRYPAAPEGHLFLGRARMWAGDFGGAVPLLQRVVAMDSLSLGRDAGPCRACDALNDLVMAHLLADSLPAAERVARRWLRVQPTSARAWRALSRTLEWQGSLTEARIARARSASLGMHDPRDLLYPAMLAIRAGRFDRADVLLDEVSGGGASLVQQNVLWFRTLSLRYQGRLEEALEVARAYRRLVADADVPAQRRPWVSVLEAEVLREMGRAGEAAALYRTMSGFEYESPARTARHRAWTLTQAATALAAAGDTAALVGLADTIRAAGARSAFGRDPPLHHYVRGLLLAARGDTVGAVAAYERARFSPTYGYGRLNLEHGRLLLALDRPDEAATRLRSALRGPLDRGNLYVDRTELHRLLARAYRAAGRPDSAAVHEAWVARARTHAPAPRQPPHAGGGPRARVPL